MNLTIVITTYNRMSVLKSLLQDLENQTDPDFQVVVAIDGSTDQTEEMLTSLNPSYEIKWINTHCSGYGLAVARNQGIIAADGEAVVILDDDSFPEPGFVAAHKNSVTHHTITGGPRNPANSKDKRMAWKMRELNRLPPCSPMLIDQLRRDWPLAFLIENNICLYRKDWIDIGLFSERLKMYGFIGQEFFARAEYLDYGFQYNPQAVIMHHGQLEGDNGFKRSKKTRQTQIAGAIRPSLMTSKHYEAQIKWAGFLALGQRDAYVLPLFRLQAGLAFPYRYLRNVASESKRRLLSSFRGKA